MNHRTLSVVLAALVALLASPASNLHAQDGQKDPATETQEPASTENRPADFPTNSEQPTTDPSDSPESQANEPSPQEQPEKPSEPEPKEQPRRLPSIGSANGPKLPGLPWRVHDILRPRPPAVAAPDSDVATPPPGDALVLFNGENLSAWAHHDREDSAALYEAQWKVQDGYFEVTRGNGDLYTIENFADVQLHIEWMVPENTRGSSQGRGNSGIKFLGLYEVQILDSYNNLTYADGQAASIYGQYPPSVNVSRPQGQWQTFDIIFEMPKFDGDDVKSPGYITVLHNGVLVHHRRELLGVTGMRSPGRFSAHPPAGPIMLQDHGNPIRFRNIWVRHLNN